jgi:hypothetical protein
MVMPSGASSMAARRAAVLNEALRKLPEMPTTRIESMLYLQKLKAEKNLSIGCAPTIGAVGSVPS